MAISSATSNINKAGAYKPSITYQKSIELDNSSLVNFPDEQNVVGYRNTLTEIRYNYIFQTDRTIDLRYRGPYPDNNTGSNRNEVIRSNKQTIIGDDSFTTYDSSNNGYKYSYSIAGPQRPLSYQQAKQGSLANSITDQNTIQLTSLPVTYDETFSDFFEPPPPTYDTCSNVWVCVRDI